MTYCEEVIISDSKRRGNGKDMSSPVRVVTEIFRKDGTCIGEHDTMGNYSIEDMIAFAGWYSTHNPLPSPIYEAFNEWLSKRGMH